MLRTLNLLLLPGFTFIELIFIMVVLSLLMVSVLPTFSQGWQAFQVERTAFDLAQRLRVARTLAVTQGQPIEWAWRSDSRSVWLQTPAGGTELTGRFRRPLVLPAEITLLVCEGADPVDTIEFRPDGTSGPVDASAPTTIVVKRATVAYYHISLDAATGDVDVTPPASVSPC